jgi:hypothetical protein
MKIYKKLYLTASFGLYYIRYNRVCLLLRYLFSYLALMHSCYNEWRCKVS